MTEVLFYHLQNATLEGVGDKRALTPKLDSRAIPSAKKLHEKDVTNEAKEVAKIETKRAKKAKPSEKDSTP